MRSYLSLVPISAKVHKRQSRMTRICIILAVFLVTSIFSMAEMWTDAETTAMRHNHGDWHIALQNVSKDEAEQIRKNSNVAVSSWYDEINTDAEQNYYIDGKNAVLYGIEESYITDIMKYPTEGVYPQNENEVALSADAKELFSVKIGDEITLDTPVGDVKYTISGFYEDDTEFNDIIGGCCVFMNRKTFDEIRRLNGVESESQFYIRFQNENGLKKTIADMMQQYNLTAENVKENTAVLGMLGASSNESVNELYPLAAACFVIILIAGVFMISSCMNSNVAQRTKFFGMMRCIGASKQQIIRFVRLEALNWCKTAIPMGCALVGVITVFIAAHSPAKQAAMVSPAAAVSGNADMSKNVNHAAKTRFLKVETSLGIHHATGTKKNLFLMTGSFALMIVLFLAFSACLDFVHKLLPSVTSKFTPDITIASQDDTNSLDGNLPDKIAEIEGVESAFGMMTRTAFSVEVNGNETEIDLFSHDKTLLDTFKKSVISGDISRVYEDGNYAMAVYNQDYRLSVGDKIKTGNQELEIVCVTSEGVGSVSGAPTVVCSEKTFMRLTGECRFAMISVVLKKDVSEAAVSKIRDLVGDCLFVDNREENSDINGSYWVFRIASYGFLAIISLITVLNITNSISMGVSARIKQYGAMRAVGMGSGQVAKMITAEAVTYAICGTAAGIILGLLLHYLIYAKIVITHFGGSWNIPFATIAIVLLLVVFSCIVAIYAPAKRIRNMAITATINEL